MTLTRRLAAVGGALALGAAGVLQSSHAFADADEGAAVLGAVAALNQAMLDADRSALESLVADALSYGHSSGMIQTKAQFVAAIVNKETTYKSIALSEPLTIMAGNNAIVRHVASVDYESGGKAATARIGVLQVWVKAETHWRLLARQAFKI